MVLDRSWRMNSVSTGHPVVGAECVGSQEDPTPYCLPGKLPELAQTPTSLPPCFQPCLKPLSLTHQHGPWESFRGHSGPHDSVRTVHFFEIQMCP